MTLLNSRYSPSAQIDEVIDLTSYALLAQVPLFQTDLEYDFYLDDSREPILAGFIPNDISITSPCHSTTRKAFSLHSAWEETKCNLSLYAGLSLSDSMVQALVNACIRHPDFMVMLRKGADAQAIHSSPIVRTSRRQHAWSSSVLTWEKTCDFVRKLAKIRSLHKWATRTNCATRSVRAPTKQRVSRKDICR